MLMLVYTGAIVINRGLDSRIAVAIKDLTDVELIIIVDRGIDTELLDKIETSNMKYKSLLQLSNALELEAYSDVIIILNDLNEPINNFAMPNKLFEIMTFGLPLITNVAPELINRVDYGIRVDYNDINQIQTAVVVWLRDNIELRRLENNGHKAFLQKYNCTEMEQELYNIHGNLLKN
jgi:glycosyltransferase involved in cell wall biosynthesis